jgi:hypothetical protein
MREVVVVHLRPGGAMNLKLVGIFLVLLMLVGAGGAVQAQKITVDSDKNLNFQEFKTYARTTGTPVKNPLFDQRIIDAVDKQMAAKGFQKVDLSANPDLIVLYHAAVGQKTELNTMNMGG